jgi:hypothetical protein
VCSSDLPANTQVVGVSGNTVTLSSTVDATQFYSVIGSFSGTANQRAIRTAVNASGSVGQLIANNIILPLSRGAIITEVRFLYFTVGKNTQKEKVYSISQSVARAAFATFSIYQFNGIPAATYNFVSTNGNYTFRANSNLPFGSYPGIGAFFT